MPNVQELEASIAQAEKALEALNNMRKEQLDSLDDLKRGLLAVKYGIKIGTIIKYRGIICRISEINPRDYGSRFMAQKKLKNGGWHKFSCSLYWFDPEKPKSRTNDYEILEATSTTYTKQA